uniref:limulus clotting factor C n=1 Tax=Glossina brevipalpis TaxID=37001 RepID=A0A1A9W7L9_9MUSC
DATRGKFELEYDCTNSSGNGPYRCSQRVEDSIKTKTYHRPEPVLLEEYKGQQQQTLPHYQQDHYAPSKVNTITRQRDATQSEAQLAQSIHDEKPIYDRRHSQLSPTGDWDVTENSITEYYTGCPSGHMGPLPYAYDCRRFLNCWHGKAHLQTCSVGTVFNPETLECDRPDKVKCSAAFGMLETRSKQKKRMDKMINPAVEDVDVLCPSGMQGLQPHPNDCAKFINCANGNIHIQDCGPGTAFSISMQVCVHKDKVDCKGRESGLSGTTYDSLIRNDKAHHDSTYTTDIMCPTGINGMFAYPFDYTKFINCKSGKTAIQNCMPGNAFSIFKGFCQPLNEIDPSEYVRYRVSEISYEYAQTLISCPPDTEGSHLYPFDFKKYIKCLQTHMIIQYCPNSQVYSSTRQRCVPAKEVKNLERFRATHYPEQTSYNLHNMVYCPIGSNGVYPHPFEFSKYLKCVNGRLISEACSSGSAYSLSRNICESKDLLNSNDKVPSIKTQKHLDYNFDVTERMVDGLIYLVCPPGLDGYFLHPFDCTKYLKCSNGHTLVESCIGGSVFSISRQKCIPRDQVEAYDRVEYKITTKNEFTSEQDHQRNLDLNLGVICNSGTFGLYPHPSDCKKFLRCANGHLMIENCTNNQVFNSLRGFCQPQEDVMPGDSKCSSLPTVYNRLPEPSPLPAPPITSTTNVYNPNIPHNPIVHGTAPNQRPYNQPQPSVVQSTSTTTNVHNSNVFYQPQMPSQRLEPPINLNSNQQKPSAPQIPHISTNNNCNKRVKYIENTYALLSVNNSNAFYRPQVPRTTGNHRLQPHSIPMATNVAVDGFNFSSTIDDDVNCPSGINGRFAHPNDCTKFLVCSNGVGYVHICGPGTAWNQELEVCDYMAKVNCSTNPATLPKQGSFNGVICPSDVEGSSQHSLDKNKFLNCQEVRTTTMNCPAGYVFDSARNICELKIKDIVPVMSYAPDSSTSQQPTIGSRWDAMNRSRPSTPINDQTGSWSQVNPTVQQAPGQRTISTQERIPVHTPISEEGSLQPNRNHNNQMFNTPLAPFPETSTTPNTIIYYAQPVEWEEDSGDVLKRPENPAYPQESSNHIQNLNRQNYSREINFTVPNNSWRPMNPPYHSRAVSPNADVSTEHLVSGTPNRPRHEVRPNSNNGYSVQSISLAPFPSQAETPIRHLVPPFYNEDEGQRSLQEKDFSITSGDSKNCSSFDHIYSNSDKVLIVDQTNLYGGLLPPLPCSPRNYVDLNDNERQVPLPLVNTTSSIYAPVAEYPQLSNATVQMFSQQPHYSSSYSGVAHSRNTSWPINSTGRKIPQHSLVKPAHSNLHPYHHKDGNQGDRNNKDITVSTITPHLVQDYNDPKYQFVSAKQLENSDNDESFSSIEMDAQNLPINEALKLLLRPYVSRNDDVRDEMAERAQEHIMNLVKNTITTSSTTSTTTTTTVKPFISTKSKNKHEQSDVELILAGEQQNLVGLSDVITESISNVQDENNMKPNRLKKEHTYISASHLRHHHHPHHKHHHNNREYYHPHHRQRIHHSREFHRTHSHLPNPFANEEPENSDRDLPAIPQTEATTPKGQEIDLRSNGIRCPFDCGNNKCVQNHEVCDGINNCGNRQDEKHCEHLGYEVRLTGGESSHMGRVEVKIHSNWGYVCDDKFGLRDADVLCKELGFKLGAVEVRGNSFYPPTDPNPNFVMDKVECQGNETSLQECDFSGWGINNCSPDEVVGVVCKIPKLKCPDNYWLCSTTKECIPTAFVCDITADCADGSDESEEICNAPIEYRLEGGRTKFEGRLEVYYRGEWGSVCDDDFTLNEAQVVCNSLGYYGKSEIVKNIYGPGSGPIWLDQVSCLGNEIALDKCNHWTWGENNCNHTEDVSLKCTYGLEPPAVRQPKTQLVANDHDLKEQQYGQKQSTELDDSDFDDLGLYQNLWQRSSKADKHQKRCGHFKADLMDEYEHPEERVINGTKAKRGHHPWQATIRTRGRGGISSHWCGAVLISKHLLLTAAHCLAGYPKGSYFVRMGDHYANIAEASEIDSYIDNWYIHEKFRDQKHMNNDIALVLLKNPVRFNDYVQPVCLPEKTAHLDAERMCTISGWGSIKSGVSTPSNILRAAQVPILPDEVCHQKHVYGNAMTDGMFCAGSLDESVDACDGDSGGPLVCSDEAGETLYGIISWGQHCGYANRPGVYVRVEKYIDWIHEKINLMMQQGKL